MKPKTRFPLAALAVAVLSCLAFVGTGCYYSADHSHPSGARSRPCPPHSPHCPDAHNHQNDRRPFRFGLINREERNDEVKEGAAAAAVAAKKSQETKGQTGQAKSDDEAKEGRFPRLLAGPPRYTNPVYVVPRGPTYYCPNCPSYPRAPGVPAIDFGPPTQFNPGYPLLYPYSPYYRPVPEQPRVPSYTPRSPDFSRAPRGEVKTGGFACSHCGRITVGDQWATDWIDGEPVTFCCRACWETMSPIERRACFENWTRRQATTARPGFGAPAGNYPRK
ncbi:MAG: hypothetical protein ACTHK7_08170 [Aureliella sp.]